MGYKCCILECKTNQSNEEKGNVAEFPTDHEDKQQWIRFVNQKKMDMDQIFKVMPLAF